MPNMTIGLTVQAIQQPAPPGQRLEFTDGQRVDVPNSTPIEITRACMMQRVGAPPEIVRRQCQHAYNASDPIVCETMAKE
jgi:hypothetical protein